MLCCSAANSPAAQSVIESSLAARPLSDPLLPGSVISDCNKKVHNFQMDSQTCPRFSGQAGHEPNDSWLTAQVNWQKEDVCITFNRIM